MTSVGARRCGRDGARGARRHDRRTSTRSTAARSRNDVLAARRALAVVVAAQVSRREVRWRSSNEAEREDDVGRRPAVRPGRRTRRTTTRSARVDEVGGAIKERRARGSARARRRRGGSSEPARRWKSSNEAEREDDVGRRPAVRPGRRTRRTTTPSARVDEVGGAIKERRARGSARARRRRGGSSEPARRWKSSNEAEREDDVGRRPAVRPGRRTRRTTTRSARVDEVDGSAIKERRARGSARARRRRGGSSEPARGAMEEQQRS